MFFARKEVSYIMIPFVVGRFHGNVFGKFSIVEPRKKPSYFPLYWLVNRDPYNGLL